MTISGWRIALLAIIALALVVSAFLSTSASAQESTRSVSAHGTLG
jgi:hypothetical protein